jgi:subtilisin family serine protease
MGLATAIALLSVAASLVTATGAYGAAAEVVVVLDGPPLARAVGQSRALTATARGERLSLRAPFERGYLDRLDARQTTLANRITRTIPGARIRWRYGVVLNGLAVALPERQIVRLRRLPGVAAVQAGSRYRARLDRSPGLIGAPLLWGPSLSTAGQGVKIAILDDGVDQRHPFFNRPGYVMPPGFPKGKTAFTTAKVIVARAFPPPSPSYRHAATPFDPLDSGHATHVAGIAAGNAGATGGGRTGLSGVAPAAYLGNYKVLTIPTAAGVGLDGNSPEIAAAIEAAVRDGMDVINLSLGEPEINPARDLVVQAIEGATRAGTVVVVSAGNDFGDFGRGSIGSPGSAPSAITVAATTKAGAVAEFSSSGPTPVSLGMKPDISAPGVAIMSSVPESDGSWAELSGTSMSSPHVAGAAALLLQRNPEWTPAQVKSALVQTAEPIARVAPPRQGGGVVRLERAVSPLLFASPTGVSLGSMRVGTSATASVTLTDAGGGGGAWAVSVDAREGTPITAPATVDVPGVLELAADGKTAGESSGYVVLTRAQDVRRIPYWLLAATPRLGPPAATLQRTGMYSGTTRGRPARVNGYRYPADPSGAGITTRLAGPELVYRVRIAKPVANFGVAILSQAAGARIEPRIVSAGDENRLAGYTALPFNLNPYLAGFSEPRRAAGVVLPAPGLYDVVFDSVSRARAGRFRFRFWIDDSRPPTIRVLGRRGGNLVVLVRDGGSGVDPQSLYATVDGVEVAGRPLGEQLLVPLQSLSRGRHRLVVRASDFQETRNMEDVPRILPNTRELRTTFVVR